MISLRPRRRPLRRLLVAAIAALTLVPSAAAGDAAAVRIDNASSPTRCAEEDNVTLTLSGQAIGAFAITALHPPYVDGLTVDNTLPDFSHCDFSADPAFAFAPRTLTLYEDERWRLVGHTFSRFWRAETPSVIVDEGGRARVEGGLHLLQLFTKSVSPPLEFLVLYPPDGYWRLKPLPPPWLADSAYGSSFLVGPVERDGRPLVRLAAVRFDAAAGAFHLSFVTGGGARLAVAALTAERARLEITLTPASVPAVPFAALRSMMVSEEVADVAEVGWQPEAAAPWRRLPLFAFPGAEAVAVRFGRSRPSRHNTSAPDLTFDGFRALRP